MTSWEIVISCLRYQESLLAKKDPHRQFSRGYPRGHGRQHSLYDGDDVGCDTVLCRATNGVGEATVRQFAKWAAAPRVYLIGRSPEAGTRIVNECKALNPQGKFTFISKDTSLIRNVDEICDGIKQKEKSVNLLFLTIGTLQTGKSKLSKFHYYYTRL